MGFKITYLNTLSTILDPNINYHLHLVCSFLIVFVDAYDIKARPQGFCSSFAMKFQYFKQPNTNLTKLFMQFLNLK